MQPLNRSAVLIAMWIGVAVAIFGISIYGAETGANITPLVLVPLILVFLTTLVMWLVPGAEERNAREADGSSGKAKRDDRLALLMDLMDEDELAAFKDALRSRLLDDDPVALDALLADQSRRARMG